MILANWFVFQVLSKEGPRSRVSYRWGPGLTHITVVFIFSMARLCTSPLLQQMPQKSLGWLTLHRSSSIRQHLSSNMYMMELRQELVTLTRFWKMYSRHTPPTLLKNKQPTTIITETKRKQKHTSNQNELSYLCITDTVDVQRRKKSETNYTFNLF